MFPRPGDGHVWGDLEMLCKTTSAFDGVYFKTNFVYMGDRDMNSLVIKILGVSLVLVAVCLTGNLACADIWNSYNDFCGLPLSTGNVTNISGSYVQSGDATRTGATPAPAPW